MLAEDIKSTLEEKSLDLKNVRGQSYNGASNMSSSASGVQGRIKQLSPKAAYVHFNSHVLNLVIAKTCSLIEVRSVIDKLKSVCWFFLNSPKREGLLQHLVTENVPNKERRKALIDLCKTRWSRRHEAYRYFYQSYHFIVEALEVMAHKLHLDKYETVREMYSDWDPKTKTEAASLLAGITSFSFIVTFVTVYMLLSHLEGITRKLQSSTLDILLAHEMVSCNYCKTW